MMHPTSDLAFIRDAVLRAADPVSALRRRLRREGLTLCAGDTVWNLAEGERVVLIAAGKAAVPMAQTAADIIGELVSGGLVITKYGHAEGHCLPGKLRVVEAGHPVPDAAGLEAAQSLSALLQTTTDHDRVVLLLSGGASALLPLPVEGVSLSDLQETTNLLLRSGATISELNTVRKHLSQLSGGQLARMAAPAPVLSLILSDVVGDRLEVIASGPTAPDPTTYADALDVLTTYGVMAEVPKTVVGHLRTGQVGCFPETPKPGDPLFGRVENVIIGSNRLAALAACEAAQARGYRPLLLSTFVEGEAREVAKVAVAIAKGIRTFGDPLASPACVVCGGETTVTVRGRGKGGRNQELALAAAIGLEGMPGVALMALATDGTDGPTDAAGAVVDGETVGRLRRLGWKPTEVLRDNNAYAALESVDALIRTGPTGTNVNDVTVILIV